MKKAGPRRGPVLFCPSHWAGEFSRDGGLPQCAPIFFLKHQKENGRTRSKEKMFRRVGPQVCGPPASGGGWLALPRSSQRRKRAALGETSSPGKSGIHPTPLSAAAHAPARNSQRVAKRNARKEKLVKCDDHPEISAGTANAGRDLDGGTVRREPAGGRQVSPEPIREAPVRAEGRRTGARRSGFSLWTGPRPVSLFGAPKREMGGGMGRPPSWPNSRVQWGGFISPQTQRRTPSL